MGWKPSSGLIGLEVRTMSEIIIQTEQLTRKYGQQISVDQLNLQVKKGQIYGFLGPNGAGKTTTIRMLLGLIKPTSGKIYLFSKELQSHLPKILRNVGSLVESPSYYGHLTGYENLEIIRSLLDLPRKEIDRVLQIVRLTNSANRQVKEYSLGMKQRLGIATALLSGPQLLILDEPTNGLDPAGIQEMRELIKSLPHDYGMTVFVSSHLLSEIDQIATHVGILNKGKFIFQGSIEQLRQKSRPQLRIAVNQPERAYEILKRLGFKAQLKDGDLWTSQTDYQLSADLNTTLVQNGLRVSRIEEKKNSLEDIFLELTGKGDSL
jgi:ABC-type multidrug transport system ATPase subunit